jgi:hypothetical protein
MWRCHTQIGSRSKGERQISDSGIELHGSVKITRGSSQNLFEMPLLKHLQRRSSDAWFRLDQPLPDDTRIGDDFPPIAK